MDRRPILVVCYINHALDQFLEGIISFCKGNVLRVIGRISSKLMQNYGLKNRRRQFPLSRALQQLIHKEKLISRDRFDTLRLTINKLAERVKNA